MYISSLLEGVSEAPGFSWKAFQCTRAWTPVDRSAVSKLRLPTQQKGQTTSLIISTTARLLSAAAMAVDMLRQVVTRGTARQANVEGYEVAGKTGTADIEFADDAYWAWILMII